jgi:serine/threonine-protein kinase
MSTNPYQPPAANVDLVEPPLEVPEEIAKKIKSAWIAGLVSVALTLIFVVISLAGTSVMGIDAWALLDAAVVAGLAFGVFRKSRTCAILLLAFFLLNKIVMWVDAGSAAGLPMTLVFLWFYFQGIVGTFQFHHWKRTANINT